MVTNTAKLQEKVEALTKIDGKGGINILTDTGDFKSTYEILLEISEVWDKIGDVNQAALLEVLAGKTRGSVVAALLQNGDILKSSYESASNASGSAQKELNTYLDSIEGRISLFKNEMQTVWMNFISSDVIKFFVDLGTEILKVIDKIGVLQSALIALVAIKGLPALAKSLGLTNLIKDIYNLTKGFKDFAIGSTAANAATLNMAMSTSLAQSSLVQLAIKLGIVTAEEVATASTTTLLGVAFRALGASILGATKAIVAFLLTNPIGWAILATAAIVGLAAVIAALNTSHKEYVEQLEETSKEIDDLRSNIESLNSELETTKSRIEELESKGPLTLTEQEELDKLKEQNAELERQIQLEEAREERAKNKQAEQAKDAFETDDDFKASTSPVTMAGNLSNGKLFRNEFDIKLDDIENAKIKLDNAEKELQDALDSGMDTESKKFKKLEENLESAQSDYTDAQSDWDEFMKNKEEEYGDLEWFDGDNLTEAQKTVNEILSSLQNYNDKAEIMFGSAGAKESALDRLFGERGSEAGQAFNEAFNEKIKSGEIDVNVDKFGDYSTAIDNVTDSVNELISENPQLKLQLDSLGVSAEDVARYFLNINNAVQQANETVSIAVTDIASITSAYESYASALQIVNESIFDGQAISDDYYDSLKTYLADVTVGEESFSDAVDTTNGKVIKNTRLLRNLVAQKKKEQKATVSAAKAQSQLQYTKIVRQLQQAVKAMALDYQAYGHVTQATYDNISAMRDQIQAIKNAVREYAILELKLSDVTNAYDEFESAKTRDAELSYGDSMIEMLQTISDGFLTGKVGSEAFKAACEALVPDSVIADCETFEERLDAIDNYFENSKFADYFTIDDDGNFSIGIKNIQAFIEDAKEVGAFIQNADGTFTLSNSIQSIEDFADAMDLTNEAAVAMVTEYSKYDASWGDILADLTMTELDRGIRDTTDALDQAIAKQEQFFKDGKDPSGANAEEYRAITQEVNDCSDALQSAQNAVIDNTNAWVEATNNVDTAKEKVSTLTRELQELQNSGATDNEIQIKTNQLEDATKELSEALQIKYGLEEPTQMDFQITLDNVQAQIDQWEKENATLVTEVVPKLAQDENGVWKIPAEAEVELSETDKQKLQAYVDLRNDEQQLELFTSAEVDPIIDEITQVKDVLDNIYSVINKDDSKSDSSGLKEEADKTSGIVNSKSTTVSSGNVAQSFYKPTTGASAGKSTTTETTKTSTSKAIGFDSSGIDQKIAAINEWALKVGEDIQNFFTVTVPEKFTGFFNTIGTFVTESIVPALVSAKDAVVNFFTETIPEKWGEFWEAVGEKFGEVKEWANGLGEKVQNFFTITLPEKWNEFWDVVGEKLGELKEWAANTGEGISTFFTETLPEKWGEFWDAVGEFFGSIPYFVGYCVGTVKVFFTETLPEKWSEFWDAVGEKIDELKQWAADMGDTIKEFFTETLPEKWSEFWDAVGEKLNDLKQWAVDLGEKAHTFFTETLPKKWNEFWDAVGEKLNEAKQWAVGVGESVKNFFTVTIPAKWSEFWDAVGTYITESVIPALVSAKDAVVNFFTVTIPAKWSEFWSAVGGYITENIVPALVSAKNAVMNFFTVTLPAKWSEFWDSVGTFVMQKIPEALTNIKTGVATFFTVTVPNAINGLWDNIASWIHEKASNFWSFLTSGFKSGYGDATSGNKYGTSKSSTSSSTTVKKKKSTGLIMAKGNANSQANLGLPNDERNAVVGELGREMVVDVDKGIYYTVGDNGTERIDLPKNAIIYNHKQTEELLRSGKTSRGTVASGGVSFAKGNAYWDYGLYTKKTGTAAKSAWGDGSSKSWSQTNSALNDTSSALNDAADSISNAADDISDAADEFEEVFDWIDIRLQEIDEELDLLNANLENAVGYSEQNNIIDQILSVNNTKMSNLQSGLQEYANYAAKLLAEIPAQYQEAAQNGSIAITEFAGEADEKTVDAINNYRDWADKVADLTQQIEELKTEIASLAKQKFDNISSQYDNVIKLIEDATDKLDAQVDLMEDRGYVAAKQYYESMMENTKQQSAELQKEKVALQDVLDQQVKLGNIKVGSDSWYEMVDALYEVDAAIVDCTANLEEYQNAINDIYWDNFDELINRLDYLNNETENLIDLMGNADIVTKPEGRTYEGGTTKYWTADDVQWTDEGIASLGLYAQQMEIAEYKAKQYGQAIDDLNKDYADGKYSESEYLEKLNELTSAQYDSIESYYDAQDSIKKLNETRIDSIKDGIEKEIDAYSELIDKKKEELDAEKDLYDWQKTVSEGQKNIADIQRKLTALSTDQSASAIAKRKKLEQELAEAKADLEEQYYDRSISDRSDALDKEQEDFENSKNKEIEKWEEYLDNIESIISDSLGIVQANASGVYDTLSAKAQEYNLTLSDAIMTPWKDGAFAVSDYQDTFDTAMSSTWDQLDSIKMKWQEIIDKMAEAAAMEIKAQQAQNNRYGSATYTPPEPAQSSQPAPAPAQKTISVGGQINAGSARIYSDSEGHGGGRQYYRNDPIYTVLKERNGYILVRHHSESSGYTGWFKKSDVTALAKGTKGLDKSGIVNVDELGEELVLRAQNGRLTYMEKGTGVIPADLTSNLMEWGQLDPRDMIEQNRPSVSVPSEIKNTEINLSISYGDMLHIEEFNGEDPDEIAKIVAKQFEKHTKDLNNALRRYSR